jgi:hypothetical protein
MAFPIKHGHMRGNHATYYYGLWKRIKQSCYDRKYQSYHNYGARGIQVYEPWRTSFQSFLGGLLADIGPRPSKLHSLDRKNNDGYYEPGNIRWATAKEQSRNRRGNHFVTALGQTRTIAEWSEISGIP